MKEYNTNDYYNNREVNLSNFNGNDFIVKNKSSSKKYLNVSGSLYYTLDK